MFKDLSKAQLRQKLEEFRAAYEKEKAKGLKLDMSRGKPGKEQLDLSEELLTVVKTNEDCVTEGGIDCRNYGNLEGIPEARKLFGDIMGLAPEEVIVGGNSSLNLMYDTIARAMIFGVYGSEKPWGKYEKIKFLCPVPGYDRHFTVTETFGIEMVNIPMRSDGPDMDAVAAQVAADDTVKGIWCVPKYSNPDGITYSDEVVRRFAKLSPKAKDFRIFWDNAYAIHSFGEEDDALLNLMEELKKSGKEDMVFMFSSTSKVSFPGSGVSAMGASKNNIELIKKQMFPQTIGPNKLNQLRHVRYYKDLDGIKAYMKRHASIIKPRFDVVFEALESNLGGEGIAQWVVPHGGYFVSCNVMEGCAKRTVALLKDAGVVMTGAGATYPYKKDPKDSNLRIAPTYPPVEELKAAMKLFCLCVKIAAAEKLLEE